MLRGMNLKRVKGRFDIHDLKRESRGVSIAAMKYESNYWHVFIKTN